MRGYHFATFDNPGTMRYIKNGRHVFVVNVICPQTGDYWSQPDHSKAVCRQYVPAYYLDEKDVDEFIGEYYTFSSYRCRYVHEIETEFKKRFRQLPLQVCPRDRNRIQKEVPPTEEDGIFQDITVKENRSKYRKEELNEAVPCEVCRTRTSTGRWLDCVATTPFLRPLCSTECRDVLHADFTKWETRHAG
jgi:hypothetical protein